MLSPIPLVRARYARPFAALLDAAGITEGPLFRTLDQNLRSWRLLVASSKARNSLQIESVEEALTRQAALYMVWKL